jgi:hypothetical protein
MGCASEAETNCDATQCDNGVVQFVEGAKMAPKIDTKEKKKQRKGDSGGRKEEGKRAV